MGVLSGPEIHRRWAQGKIEIDPFFPEMVQANSLDVRLGTQLLRMLDPVFDLSRPIMKTEELEIPPEGFVLQPGIGYLACTVERIKCYDCVPYIDGRSTVGRYFLLTHHTAGRGDVKFDGQFTLELMATYRPVRIYAGMAIAQITFMDMVGRGSEYTGRYNHQTGPRLPSPLPLPVPPPAGRSLAERIREEIEEHGEINDGYFDVPKEGE